MKYNILLFDIDDTVLDFSKAEEYSFFRTFKENDIAVSEEMFENYKIINKSLWKDYENGLTTKPELMVERYRRFFEKYNINADPAEINKQYLHNLSYGSFTISGAKAFLDSIKNDFKIYAVTNGEEKAQKRRIETSEINGYFEKIITSEKAGANKPFKKFFEYAVRELQIDLNYDKVLLIGDSLTADIKGANDFGMDSCWFNPENKENIYDILPTYEVKNYDEIKKLIY